MIGLEKGTVRLEKHDPEWEAEARRTIDKLKDCLLYTSIMHCRDFHTERTYIKYYEVYSKRTRGSQ